MNKINFIKEIIYPYPFHSVCTIYSSILSTYSASTMLLRTAYSSYYGTSAAASGTNGICYITEDYAGFLIFYDAARFFKITCLRGSARSRLRLP